MKIHPQTSVVRIGRLENHNEKESSNYHVTATSVLAEESDELTILPIVAEYNLTGIVSIGISNIGLKAIRVFPGKMWVWQY